MILDKETVLAVEPIVAKPLKKLIESYLELLERNKTLEDVFKEAETVCADGLYLEFTKPNNLLWNLKQAVSKVDKK